MYILKKIGKVLLIILGSLLTLYLLLFIISKILGRPINEAAWYKGYSHPVLIFAHQGGEGEYPSNTKLAFVHAVADGSDVLDTDMHMTKDGVLILAHDETLDNRTDSKGALRDKTLAELKQVDFAYNWSPDSGKTYPFRAHGISVYTLNELFADFPDMHYGIEIKQTTTDAAVKFCSIIKQYKKENQVLVSSVTQPNMSVFRKACPTVATSATDPEATKFFVLQKIGLVGLDRPKFSSLQVPGKQGSLTIASKAFSGNAHRLGLKVINWTIDTPEQAKHFIDLGADGIITSYPQRVLNAGIH